MDNQVENLLAFQHNDLSMSGKHNYKFLSLMMMIYVTCLLTTVVLTYKMVALGPLLEPAGVFVFPLTYFFCDVVAEVYGYSQSRRMIWYSLICEFIFCMCVGALIKLPSPSFWHHQIAYNVVLGLAPRFFFANSIATVAGAFTNTYIISKWKILMEGKFFWLRSLGSTAIGEAVFTSILVIIAFTQIISFHLQLEMIISMYVFKLFYGIIAVWPATLLVIFLKYKEDTDVYDYNTNFNPFKIDT